MELGKLHLNLKTLLLTTMMFKWGILCSASSDRCLSAPCRNGATCVDTADDYACICARGGLRFMGKQCEQLYDACVFAPCEHCVSQPGSTEYRCVCPDGLTGDNCTEEVDECLSDPCSAPRSLCVDQLNGYFCRCPEGYGGRDCRTHVTDCIDEPCRNNGTCLLRPQGFECRCAPGFEGATCEEDVNECASEPCQNGAICLDGTAEFHCFCVPGFQGYTCEIDINECASRPCHNNATCINEKDHYECECLHGFTGVNCETEIDECDSSPCRNGATCLDMIGMYSCDCPPGFDGVDCEIDLDECESQPCQNGAVCHDLVNGYACDCTDTGFEGNHCEMDIPECASNPCQHGATCQERVRGYSCLCWTGYEGSHCEVDVDECTEQPCENGGECFERSDPSHWDMEWELSFADASGYICQCQPGFAGENCSVNINECESEPCQNGALCSDRVNGYVCVCPPGFLGEQCEVNVDECESQPCQNGGWCEDGRASYTCHCPDPAPGSLPWGGEHCQTRLSGCLHHRCQNGATCRPWLQGEEHGHTCICPHGFYDQHCSTSTTFSFSSPGLLRLKVALQEEHRRRREVEHWPHQGLGVQLRFRTTLPSMPLFLRGDEESHLLLELVGGALQARAVSEDAELEVRSSTVVSDGEWWEAHVVLDAQGLALTVHGPSCGSDGCKVVDDGASEPRLQPSPAFAQVFVGGVPEELLDSTQSKTTAFIGCMEDLMIDSKPILPQDLPEDLGLELGCSKTEWCESEPCGEHGSCVDLWTSFYCSCHRPHHGARCSEEYPSWTYGPERSLSFSTFDISQSHGSIFNISLFLRSTKPNGLLLQLRRGSRSGEDQVYFSVYLSMGRVLVSSEPHSAPLSAPVFITTGDRQFLRLEVQQHHVVFEHSGLRYSIGELSSVNISRGDLAYVGGLPEPWSTEPWGGHYKGCVQDLRLDSALLSVGQKDQDQDQVYTSSSHENLREGCVSDNTCQSQPCRNGGRCTVTFNDFTCTCSGEFTGKTCETRVWCVSGPCTDGGLCVDLPDGYECVYNATFENTAVQYSAGGSLAEPVSSVYLELRTRSENAVLLRAARGGDMLLVGLLDSTVLLQIQRGNTVEALTLTGMRRVADGRWHRVNVAIAEPQRKVSPWVITVDGIIDANSAPEVTGRLTFLNQKSASLTVAQSFSGCLGMVRVGGVYLPFVDDYRAPQPSQFHLVGKPQIHLGCSGAPVCQSDPCLHGGTCQDLFNEIGCVCAAGWEGPRCEVDTDDCASQPCARGSCRDALAGFQCECPPGFAGTLCEQDLDECEHHACQHGATCRDGPNAYTCECPHDYSGPLCQWSYPPEQCGADVLCLNDAVCHDGLWGANCTCLPGFSGSRCEVEINECESNPCKNGGSCSDHFNMFVCECAPGFSGPTCDNDTLARRHSAPWLLVVVPLLSLCVLVVIIALSFMVQTARRKRQSEGAYSPSTQELAGARLEMDSMLKVPPEERLI